jgi:hypothetical protein
MPGPPRGAKGRERVPLEVAERLGTAQRHFLICLDVWAGRKSLVLGVWAASGGREILPKGGGVAQTPKNGDCRPAQQSRKTEKRC